MRAHAAILALVLACTACATMPPSRSAPENPGDYCGEPGADATSTWLDLGTEHFAVSTTGSGPTAVVFANQLGRDSCGFWPFASALADDDVRAVLVGVCGSAQSNCTASDDFGASDIAALSTVAGQLRDEGAKRIVVVGSSVTGTAAIGAVAAHPELFDAVASLSGPISALGVHSLDLAPSIVMPVFLASDANDPTVTPEEFATLAALLGGPVTVDTTGTGHGTVMLRDERGISTTLAAQLAAFIRG